MKKKILHIIGNLEAGGAEKLIDDMLPLLASNNLFQIELFILTKKGNVFLDKIHDEDIKITYSPIDNIRDPRNIYYIYKYIKKNNIDIVHSHLFPEKYFVAFVSFFMSKTKFIMTEHSTHNRRRNYKMLRFIEKIIYNQYHKIVSITSATQSNLMNWLKIKKDDKRFTIINNGIYVDEFKNATPYQKQKLDARLAENNILLLMVGSFKNQKDQETIIRSLKRLDSNIYLILVGEGPNKEKLIKVSKDYGVENRVIFLGIRTDVPRIFQTIDISVISSNWEGFGLVAVEAMAASKPVIASNIPGLSDVVRDTGILFKPKNDQDLADKINEILKNVSLQKKLQKQSLKRAYDYDLKVTAESYEAVYSKMLQ